MPKGAELHHHLTGAVWAEAIIDIAADAGLCASNTTGKLSSPPCVPGAVPVVDAYTDGGLYTYLVDTWSLREANGGYADANHDHFFRIFGDFAEIGAHTHA